MTYKLLYRLILVACILHIVSARDADIEGKGINIDQPVKRIEEVMPRHEKALRILFNLNDSIDASEAARLFLSNYRFLIHSNNPSRKKFAVQSYLLHMYANLRNSEYTCELSSAEVRRLHIGPHWQHFNRYTVFMSYLISKCAFNSAPIVYFPSSAHKVALASTLVFTSTYERLYGDYNDYMLDILNDMEIIQSTMVFNDLLKMRVYLKQGAYQGVLQVGNNILLSNAPGLTHGKYIPEVIYSMFLAFIDLQLYKQAKLYLSLLNHNFPGHSLYFEGYEELRNLGRL